MQGLLEQFPDNPYVLLTPGPLSTTKSVKSVMLRDWCTWDTDYNEIVQEIRSRLISLAETGFPIHNAKNLLSSQYTAVLMQGSGTFCVESVIGSAIPRGGKLLVIVNGAYGRRMVQIASYYQIETSVLESAENTHPDLEQLERMLGARSDISHVAVVHGETSTGMLNPIEKIGRMAKASGKTFILDAMSTFGGIPIDLDATGIDFLISSANKCVQGVPGFGFIIARRDAMGGCMGRGRSLSLDLHEQWKGMEEGGGKWRFTSPTHTVRAFLQALIELGEEGGTPARHARYTENQRVLSEGMTALGFTPFLSEDIQSPIITSFYNPKGTAYSFQEFYGLLKQKGFVIYPGKVSGADTFRIGTIGEVGPDDIRGLMDAVRESKFW